MTKLPTVASSAASLSSSHRLVGSVPFSRGKFNMADTKMESKKDNRNLPWYVVKS